MSDKSRERLYLPEFELEVPGTKLKNKCPAFFFGWQEGCKWFSLR